MSALPDSPTLLLIGLVQAAILPPATAQQEPEAPPARQAPIVVTATRLTQDPFEVPFSTETITEETLRQRAYRTTPQVLRDVPGVMVQETAHGHGSPYIRGFTSFRTLFMIDGVRLNNSAFRPGPNQYWNTVDPYSLDRLEVVKGPSSVLYGSDAVGGTVNAFTKNPYTYAAKGLAWGGATHARYATAENSLHGRGELSFGLTHEDGSRTGVLLGGTAKAFGDVEGGGGVGVQPGTGYDETALDIKVEHWLDRDTRIVFLHQNLAQDDVPRTHRTVDGITWRGLSSGSDLARNFDQGRHLTYLQYHRQNMGGAIESVHANLSWHRQVEVQNRVRGGGAWEDQGFDVGTLGAWLQLESPSPFGRVTYGVEIYHDDVNSFLRKESPGASDWIQGPIANDATYDLAGAYVQDQFDVTDDLEITLGGRFTYAAADAKSVRDPVSEARIALDDDWSSFTGSARFRYAAVRDRVNVFGGVSQGFRAPNLSDLTRFDSARSNELEIPAPDLDPEDYVSYELGTKVETDDLSVQTGYFYTDISDQILRYPTGNTNAGETEITKANIGDGHIDGVEFGAAWRFRPELTAFGNATYMSGRITNYENNTSTLAKDYPTRLMPFTAQLGLRWEEATGRYWAETVVVHAEDADKLSFGDLRDTSRIPPGGTPGYTIWHLRGGWQVSESSSVELLFENVTDVDYRVHGSGLNRPGRNFVIGFSTRF